MSRRILLLSMSLLFSTNAFSADIGKCLKDISLTMEKASHMRLVEGFDDNSRFISTSAKSIYEGLVKNIQSFPDNYTCNEVKNTIWNKHFIVEFQSRHESDRVYEIKASDLGAGGSGAGNWHLDMSIKFL